MYTSLSASGLMVSRIVLGTATFGVAPDTQSALGLIEAALAAGVTTVDTANSYGDQARFDRPGVPPWTLRPSAEALIGEALQGRRDMAVISTKVGEPIGDGTNDSGLGRTHILRSVERSLQRLRTDYLDMLVAHHPDPSTSPSEWLRTMDDLIQQGVIRHYGISNFEEWQLRDVLAECLRHGYTRPVCMHVKYSLARRRAEAEVLPASRHAEIDVIAYAPLAGGLLTDRSSQSELAGDTRWGGAAYTEADLDLSRRLQARAREWGVRASDLAIAWVLAQPGVACTVIGPETVQQLEHAVAAQALALPPDRLALVGSLSSTAQADWNE
ncbi:MAG: aldo/keto reductase [Microbacteriaceae bacterium]